MRWAACNRACDTFNGTGVTNDCTTYIVHIVFQPRQIHTPYPYTGCSSFLAVPSSRLIFNECIDLFFKQRFDRQVVSFWILSAYMYHSLHLKLNFYEINPLHLNGDSQSPLGFDAATRVASEKWQWPFMFDISGRTSKYKNIMVNLCIFHFISAKLSKKF